MNELDTKSMESLAAWLGTLGTEVEQLATVLESEQLPPVARQLAERCLTYWTRSTNLGVDGIEELRLIDVAMVFRTLADFSVVKAPAGEQEDSRQPEKSQGAEEADVEKAAVEKSTADRPTANMSTMQADAILHRLSFGAASVRQLLGDDYGRLARFASNLHDPIFHENESSVEHAAARSALVDEARQWAKGYEAPAQRVDENALIKVRAFARARYLETSEPEVPQGLSA